MALTLSDVPDSYSPFQPLSFSRGSMAGTGRKRRIRRTGTTVRMPCPARGYSGCVSEQSRHDDKVYAESRKHVRACDREGSGRLVGDFDAANHGCLNRFSAWNHPRQVLPEHSPSRSDQAIRASGRTTSKPAFRVIAASVPRTDPPRARERRVCSRLPQCPDAVRNTMNIHRSFLRDGALPGREQ